MYLLIYLQLGCLAVYFLYNGKYELMKMLFFFLAEPEEELTEKDFDVSYYLGGLLMILLWPVLITIAYFD